MCLAHLQGRASGDGALPGSSAARGGQCTWEEAGGAGVWAGCDARSGLIFLSACRGG